MDSLAYDTNENKKSGWYVIRTRNETNCASISSEHECCSDKGMNKQLLQLKPDVLRFLAYGFFTTLHVTLTVLSFQQKVLCSVEAARKPPQTSVRFAITKPLLDCKGKRAPSTSREILRYELFAQRSAKDWPSTHPAVPSERSWIVRSPVATGKGKWRVLTWEGPWSTVQKPVEKEHGFWSQTVPV